MARFGFCGSSYTSQSLNVDCQMLMNWYLEQNDSNSKSAFALYPTPGTKVFCTLPDSPGRGELLVNGRMFSVQGSTFFEVFADKTFINRGAVVQGGLPASMTSSATQVLIVSGGHTYSYNLDNLTPLADQTTQMLGVPSMCGYKDGFFIVLLKNSNQFQISVVLDATTWNGADTSKVSVFPDNIVSMIVDHNELWFFGLTKSIGYYTTGNTFPFSPIPGSIIEQGCGAQFSPCRIDNSFFWWGADERGAMVAWRAQGYQPIRISNHAIEFAVQGYSLTSDAISYAYQDQGHTFWQTYFPSANGGLGATWIYDAATGQWHQRGRLIRGVIGAHSSNCHVFAFNKHLVGDPFSGNIYQMSIPVADGLGGWLFADDAGNPIRRIRRAPLLSLEGQRMFFEELQIDVEVGLGPVPALTDGAGNPHDPQMMLRWSDNSAKTWSNETVLDCGQSGEYTARAIARRLGSAMIGRVFEISCSDPIPWRIADAYLTGTGFQTTQRLTSRLSQGA